MPVAMPPVRVMANQVQKLNFGFASLPPILILPSLENMATTTSTKLAMMVSWKSQPKLSSDQKKSVLQVFVRASLLTMPTIAARAMTMYAGVKTSQRMAFFISVPFSLPTIIPP